MFVGKFCKGMRMFPHNFVFVCLLEFSFTVILKEITYKEKFANNRKPFKRVYYTKVRVYFFFAVL